MATIKSSVFGLTMAAALSLTGTANAAISAGQSIGLDFANGPNTPGAGAEVNFNLADRDTTINSVIDTSGNTVAGLSINITGAANGGGASSAMSESTLGFGAAGVGDYTGTPFSDLSFNDGIYTSPDKSILVTFAGLDNALNYNVLVLTAGPTNQDNTVTTTVAGTAVNRTYNEFRTGNVLNPVSFLGVSTDGAGNLVVTTDSGGFYGVNAIHLTAVDAIPEPASIALIGVGAMLMLRRRRAC